MLEKLVDEVLHVAAQHPEGFTYHLQRKTLVKVGIVVAYLETQDSFEKEGLRKCIFHALENRTNVVGGWRNEEGVLQFDSVRIFFSRSQALEFARQNKQRAIFDLTNLEEIRVE